MMNILHKCKNKQGFLFMLLRFVAKVMSIKFSGRQNYNYQQIKFRLVKQKL